MNNRNTFHWLTATAAATLLAFAPQRSSASIIQGSISMDGGGDVFYSGSGGTGQVAFDLTQAKSVVLGPTVTAGGSSGSFAAIATGSPIVTSGFIDVNMPALPSNPIWSVGGFTFTALTISEPVDSSTLIELMATGTIHDTSGLQSDTYGTWTAAFTSSGNAAGFGGTFAWAGSSATPEPTSLAGFAIASTALLRSRRSHRKS